MRSISCAIISFVLFYIALHFKKNHWKQRGVVNYSITHHGWNCNHTNDIWNVITHIYYVIERN